MSTIVSFSRPKSTLCFICRELVTGAPTGFSVESERGVGGTSRDQQVELQLGALIQNNRKSDCVLLDNVSLFKKS
jgi:hypothetical protein